MTQRINLDLWSTDDDVEVIVTHDHPVELDQSVTVVKVNDEGMIIDFFQDGELTGTLSRTFEEWFALAELLAKGSES